MAPGFSKKLSVHLKIYVDLKLFPLSTVRHVVESLDLEPDVQ